MVDLKVYYHSSEHMDEVPDESIHLVITSPPYNVGKNYGEGHNDSQPVGDYVKLISNVVKECYKKTVVGGRMAINIPFIGNSYFLKKSDCLQFYPNVYTPIFQDAGWSFRDFIVWQKSKTGDPNMFSGNSTQWGSWMKPSCLLKNNLIYTKQGIISPVESIFLGQEVLTNDGTFKAVKKTIQKNYSGKVISFNIQSGFFQPLTVTEDHPVYVRERKTISCNRKRKYIWSSPFWCPAGNIFENYQIKKDYGRVNDIRIFAGIPIPNFKSEYPKWFASINLPYKQSDFWFLVGYFLGDGYLGRVHNAFYRSIKSPRRRGNPKYIIKFSNGFEIREKETYLKISLLKRKGLSHQQIAQKCNITRRRIKKIWSIVKEMDLSWLEWQRYRKNGNQLVSLKNKKSYGIELFCANIEEANLIEKMIKSLFKNLKINVKKSNNKEMYNISFSYKELWLFLTSFYEYGSLKKYGNKSDMKIIPWWVLNLPFNDLKSFVKGYDLADGTKKCSGFKISSISLKNIIQLRWAMLRCFNKWGHICKTKGVFSDKLCYRLTMNPNSKINIENNFVWLPIKKIEVSNVKNEQVFDLEILKNHNFTTMCGIVHNCPYMRCFIESILVFHKKDKVLHSKNTKTDLTKEIFLRDTKNLWYFPAETNREHPAPFPIELPKRLIRLYTFIGDTVMDPFLGSGTTLRACRELGRNGIGYEINEKDYRKLIERKTVIGTPNLAEFSNE